MDERNQALPQPPSPEPVAGPPRPPDPFAAGPPPAAPPVGPDVQRGLWIWLGLIVALAGGGTWLGRTEVAALAALAGLFIAAQAADLDPRRRWRLLYWLLTWVVPAGGVALFAGVASLALSGPLSPAMRVAMVAYCVLAGAVCVLLAVRPVGDALAVRLFRQDPPGHSLRLTMRLAIGALMFAVPGVVVLRDQIGQLATPSGGLISRGGLVGQLVGMVVLALAAVGFLVRRDGRQTIERLGLKPITLTQFVLAAAGAGVLMLLNAGTEQVQRAWFPALWAQDRAMNTLLTHGLGPAEALLLGVSAGVGEEVTIRGALQPRLGLMLSSALFAALHVQYSWFGMLVVLMIGLVLGAVRARTSTTVAIVVHALYDIMAVVTN